MMSWMGDIAGELSTAVQFIHLVEMGDSTQVMHDVAHTTI